MIKKTRRRMGVGFLRAKRIDSAKRRRSAPIRTRTSLSETDTHAAGRLRVLFFWTLLSYADALVFVDCRGWTLEKTNRVRISSSTG